MKESEIRPDELMEGQRLAVLKDVGKLLSRCDEFVSVSCPACGSAENSLRFEKNGFLYRNCQICESFYISPRPTPEVLDWFYQNSDNYAYWAKHIFPASEDARREKIIRPRVDRVMRLCEKYGIETSEASLLEVGAGYGSFCDEIRRSGDFGSVVALEPTPELAASCRDKNIDVVEKTVEQYALQSNANFDVVVSFEVVEHLFSPHQVLSGIARLVKESGLLVVTCPNGKGFDVEVLGVHGSTVDHEHLNYFNPASMKVLFERSGFELLDVFTPGALDAELVRNAVREGRLSLSGQPFLERVLLDDWDIAGEAFQDFIKKAGLSSHMWAIGRKSPKKGLQ